MSYSLAFVAGALSGAVVLALAWLAHSERKARRAIEHQIGLLNGELANLTRVRQNRLYREKLEDIGFAASQGALRVSALRAQMEEELRVIEAILSRRSQS